MACRLMLKRTRYIPALILACASVYVPLQAASFISDRGAQSGQPGQWPLQPGQSWIIASDTDGTSRLHLDLMAAFALCRYPATKYRIEESSHPAETYASLAGRFPSIQELFHADLLTVELGRSDVRTWYPNSTDFLTNPGSPPRNLLNAARERNTSLVIISPAADLPTAADGRLVEFLRKLRGFAIGNNIRYLDLYEVSHGFSHSHGRSTHQSGGQIVNQVLQAAAILKMLGANGTVSSAALDAESGNLLDSQNAIVTQIRRQAKMIEFMRTDAALPFPLPGGFSADDLPDEDTELGSSRDLFGMSRYVLRLTNLAPGRYRLLIDGESIAEFTANELSNGVDLGLINRGPLAKQSYRVLEAVTDKENGGRTSESELWKLARPTAHLWMVEAVSGEKVRGEKTKASHIVTRFRD